MDCLFNWPRRPNAVLMGTKQVGTQSSHFGGPRDQTGRGPMLTFWSPKFQRQTCRAQWVGAWRDAVMGKDERRKFSRGFTWSGRCGSQPCRQSSARLSGWRVRGWRQGWLPRRQRLHVNPLSENFRGVTNQLRPLWRFSDCVRRKLSPEKITM